MSALAAELAGLDLSRTRPVPLARLVRVELRKMADTRAGMWLLIGMCGLTALVMTIFLVTADQPDRTFMRLMGAAAIPLAALLPVLGILLVTSEWSQRTALVSFTLEPVRLRVASKMFAALMLGLDAAIVTVTIATFFVLSTAFGLVVSMWKALSDIGPWVNFNAASGVLLEPRSMTGEEWGHFGVASLIWIALPLIAGLFRVLRREVK
jgi:ABC-2 type transport system permease protein